MATVLLAIPAAVLVLVPIHLPGALVAFRVIPAIRLAFVAFVSIPVGSFFAPIALVVVPVGMVTVVAFVAPPVVIST